MTIIEQKKVLRKAMLLDRAKFSRKKKLQYDDWIRAELWTIISRENYQKIHCYLPMGTEINITPLIKKLLDSGRVVVAPKTLPNRKLQNLVLHALDQVEDGVFGTTYPAGGNTYNGHFDLIIIPGLAFDSENYRLGYGGGYYDNFIVNHNEAKKIGIFYPFQKIDQVPVEPHDIQLDNILVNEALG